jgi:hypothetical protein
MRDDGSAVIAKDYWYKGNDFKRMTENPYLFEIGMKVVDIFSNIVTIKEIHNVYRTLFDEHYLIKELDTQLPSKEQGILVHDMFLHKNTGS